MKKYSCARCGKGKVRYRTPSLFRVMVVEKTKRLKFYGKKKV